MDESATLSALDWWQAAGVDVVIDESPRNWLARADPVPVADIAGAMRQPAPTLAAALPDDLAAVRQALAELDVPGAGPERLLPEGEVASGLMILLGMPETDDGFEGRLLSGTPGRLFDRMLGAIGRDRASAYLAAILPARPAGGRMEAEAETAVRLARRHIALAAPRVVLLVGDAACRAILGSGAAAARGRIHLIEEDGASIRAVATFHPCTLLDHPRQKAGAWQDLQMLLGELER